MKSITRKSEIKMQVDAALLAFGSTDISVFTNELHERILKSKVKFPLLEYCATQLYDVIPGKEQLKICDQIAALQTIGGNVLLGIILQKRLKDHFKESFDQAAKYIAAGEAWYVTDIIGERVFGAALLNHPAKALAELKKFARHESTWVVRSIGAGAHYAIKKGLDKKNADALFRILLSLASAEDFHIRTGIGWAAKTTAKFHPGIIATYQAEISDPAVGKWFRRKVSIGLERNTYAKTHRG